MHYVFALKGNTYIRKVSDTDTFRILSHPYQYHLIKECQGLGKVEICSLNQFDLDRSDDPDYMLETMDGSAQMKVPPNVGGFRPLTTPEESALYLGIAPFDSYGTSPLFIKNLTLHPTVGSGIAFAFGGDISDALVKMLAFIYDIRRFVDPEHPTRNSRLKSFFKLATPKPLVQFLGSQIVDELTARPSMAMLGWYLHPYHQMSREEHDANPAAFLFRDAQVYLDEYSKLYSIDEARPLALWKTTNRFLMFTKMMWVAGVSDNPFVPERFFKRQDESDAFVEYTKGFPKLEFDNGSEA